jgi:hypothetical protein
MARFLWRNWIHEPETRLVASSESSAFPVSWVRDPLRSRAWRSRLGWNIVTGFNDTLVLREGGVVHAVTLPPGNHVTGQGLAAAVTAAIAGTSGLANTYSASYSGRFSIQRETGAAPFDLVFSDPSSNLHVDLGFLSQDHTGSDVYQAERAALHSREYLAVDLGVEREIACAAVVGHLKGGSTTLLLADGSRITLLPSADDTLRLAFFAPRSVQSLRVLVDDIENEAGFSQVGVVFLGTFFEPSRAPQVGYRDGREDLSTIVRADQGAYFQSRKPTLRRWELDFGRLKTSDKAGLDEMAEKLGTGRPFFVALKNSSDDTRYAVLASPLSYSHQIGDGEPPERWNVTVELIEARG